MLLIQTIKRNKMHMHVKRNNKLSTIPSSNAHQEAPANSRNSSWNSRRSRKSKSPLDIQTHQLQRQGYGPTVSVFHNTTNSFISNTPEVNRNNKNQRSQMPPDNQNDTLIQNILMLSLQNQRLSLIVETLQKQLNNNSQGYYQIKYQQIMTKIQSEQRNRNFQSRQNDRLKQEVVNLQLIVQNFEKTRTAKEFQHQRSNNQAILYQNQWKRQKNTLANQISQLKISNEHLKKKSVSLEDRVEQLARQKKYFEQKAQRANVQASNLRMSNIFNMSGDMSKSFAKEKANQINLWKEKANKFQSLLSQQKFYINSLQEQNNRAKKRQQQKNVRLEELLQKRRQPEKVSKGTVTQDKLQFFSFNQKNYEVQEIKREIEKKTQQLIYKSRQINQLNHRIKQLQVQLKNEKKQREKVPKSNKDSIQQLQQKLSNSIRAHEKLQKIIQKDRQQHQIQLTMLRNSINQLKAVLRDKQHEIQRKQSEMAVILRRRKGGTTDGSKQEQVKVIRVKSISSSSLEQSKNPRSCSIQIDAILNGVKQVQTSNERMGKLINSRSASHFRSFSSQKQKNHANQHPNDESVNYGNKNEVKHSYYANETFYKKN